MFYALDARSGAERWSFQSPGRISGAVSVIGPVVYFANLESRETHGLDVRTGKEVFRHEGGGFAPPISDGKTLYLTGYATQLAFKPRTGSSKRVRVRDVELVKRIETAGVREREGAPDRAAVTDAQRGQRPALDVGERRLDAVGVLAERLAAGEAEVAAAARHAAHSSGSSRSISSSSRPSQLPRFDSASRSSTTSSSPSCAGDDLGRLARAREVARVDRGEVPRSRTASASSRACARPRSFSGVSIQPWTRGGGTLSSVSP